MNLTACLNSKKIKKPDYEYCFNIPIPSMVGYCGCQTAQSKKKYILPPAACAEMKSGEVFFLKPKAIGEQREFALSICELTKACDKDLVKEIDSEFKGVLEAPKNILKIEATTKAK